MEKKKLLVLLGAGSSIPWGMPSVTTIGEQMKAWSRVLAQRPTAPDFFNLLWDTARSYRANSPFPDAGSVEPSFEQVLGYMIGLAGWETPSPRGNVLKRAVIDGALPENWVVPMANPDMYKYGQQVVILHQLVKLLGELARYMRRSSRTIEPSSSSFSRYRSVLSGLRDQFDVGVYNLNYDGMAVAAWPDAFNGFDDAGKFTPRAIFQRKEWDFIYHLHGSVHHTLREELGSEIHWAPDIAAQGFHDGDAVPPSQMLSDDKIFPRTTLIAGGFKLDQLLLDPFQAFYASFIRHAYEADAILIAGYGFGDAHVNHAISNRLSRGTDRPPVVVVTKSSSDDELMGGREINRDPWGWNLSRFLRCSFDLNSSSVEGESKVSNLTERGEFEESRGQAVGVWHGGFETVSSSLNSFISRLETAPSS